MGGARLKTRDLLLVRTLGGSRGVCVWLYSVDSRTDVVPVQASF
jgi:hypothetical protein